MDKYSIGLENLQKIDGNSGEEVVKRLKEVEPDLSKYIVEFAFGEIYNRGALSLQERELITLSTLITQGCCEEQLKVHINAAKNVGIKDDKIMEVAIQCIPYVGFPKVINAVMLIDRILKK